ncbi:MAG: disulfide reductase [Methanosarcinales archaeon]
MSIVAIVIFLIGMYINFKKWGNGSAMAFWRNFVEMAKREENPSILNTIVMDVLLLRRTYQRSKVRWIMHMSIFYGFVALFILTIVAFVYEVPYLTGKTTLEAVHAARESLAIPNYIFSGVLTIGIAIAILRRVFIKDAREGSLAGYDWLWIGFLALVLITGFAADYFRTGFSFSASTLSPNPTSIPIAIFHVVISLAFIALLPFSKFVHLFATPLIIIANGGGK